MSSTAAVVVRRATVDDLPAVQQLIRQSFAAMVEHSCFGKDFWESGATKLNESELSPTEFEKTYLKCGDNNFWVAEHQSIDPPIVGCVGFKRESNSPSGELVRMAVSESVRGSGIGAHLISTLITYTESLRPGLEKIHLTTGNPRSGVFYERHGFEKFDRWLFLYMERKV